MAPFGIVHPAAGDSSLFGKSFLCETRPAPEAPNFVAEVRHSVECDENLIHAAPQECDGTVTLAECYGSITFAFGLRSRTIRAGTVGEAVYAMVLNGSRGKPHLVGSLHGLVPRIDSSFYWAAAPPGSGYADWNALLALGWGTQVPVQVQIAVPIRNLVPPKMPLKGEEVVYKYRPNPRRRDLNWNEATLLEGARYCGAADPRLWGSAISGIVEGNWKYKPRTPINKERLLWAAESERVDSKWPAGEGEMSFDSVMSILASELPDLVEVG